MVGEGEHGRGKGCREGEDVNGIYSGPPARLYAGRGADDGLENVGGRREARETI